LINFFKINTVYKFLLWFLLFWAIRLPVILYQFPVLNLELSAALVAEKLQMGFGLYTQVWDDIAPLSALFYTLVVAVFGKSWLAFHLIASLLVLGQAMLLHQILQTQRVFNERSLLSILIFTVLMSWYLDFFILSPILLANTFLLIVIRYLFLHIQEKRRYNAVFEIGAYLGIATLFYLPCFLFLLVPIISFSSFTATKLKDYLLLGAAFLFTLGIAFLGFYLVDAEYAFFLSFFQTRFQLRPVFLLQAVDFLWLFAFPLLLFGLIFFQSYQYKLTNNYQERSLTMMNTWFGVAVFSIFWDTEVSAIHFIPAVSALTFILTHFFLQQGLIWVKELIFMLLLLNGLFFTYTTLYKQVLVLEVPFTNWGRFSIFIEGRALIAQKHPRADRLSNKKVLVLGHNKGGYLNARLATPYLNERLAKYHFNNFDQYNILVETYQNFRNDMPEVIIDENGKVKQLFAKIPLLAQQYQKLPNSNLYLQKK
jgi:hypothetical protein